MDIEAFLDQITAPDVVLRITQRTGHSESAVNKLLATFAGEAREGIDIARRGIDPTKRSIEIGAGIGLVSLFFASQGYPITALEPIAEGYEFFDVAREEILKKFPDVDLKVITNSAEELNRHQHGKFDFVFSTNVLGSRLIQIQ